MIATHTRRSSRLGYYSPLLDGTSDSLGFEAGDANLFRYVGNSPVDSVDPSGLEGKKTVETGIKGIKLFIEWMPNRNTGEIKILTKEGAELAIAKWLFDPKTGETVCKLPARHAKHLLPGVAQSTLKKIMPKLTQEMAKNVQRIGGTWVLTKLAKPAETGGRLGLGRAAAATGKFGLSAILGAILTLLTDLENTCQAAEIERPRYIELDSNSLGLTEEELSELINSLEESMSEEDGGWYRRKKSSEAK